MTNTMAFYRTYTKLGGSKGRGFIPIYQIRSTLNWQRQRFDDVLLALIESDVVEGAQGNPASMTEEEIENSFVDPAHRLLTCCTWWGDEPPT